MADVKKLSQKKVVTIEECALQFDKRDLAEMIEAENPETTVDPRDVTVCVSAPAGEESRVGDLSAPGTRVIGASQLLEMARSRNQEIPEDAEIVISVRWRKEVECGFVPAQQPMYAAASQQPMPMYAAAPQQPMAAPGGQQIDPQDAMQCATCGGVPGIQGPTPDCQDVLGCGRVRQLRGDLPVPKALDVQGAPQVGVGLGAPMRGTQKLTNRETGKTVFADRDGAPYGHHDDYAK